MGPTPKSPAGRIGSATASGTLDRRTIVASALVLLVVLIGGIALVSVSVDSGPRQDTRDQLTEDGGTKPHIIPRPGDGQAPEDAGDLGGWGQLSLFGLILGSMAGIGVVIFRGGRKARAGRAAWTAAAATGHDGAVDGRGHAIDDPEPAGSRAGPA